MLNRRNLLGAGAAALGALSLPAEALAAIHRAAALPAHARTGTIQDVEHVVILMQENRSFDHYLGTLGGVRGYHDRITVPPRNGRTVWRQSDGMGVEIAPFLMDRDHTASQHVHSLPHSWVDGHAAGAGGAWDNWVPAKGPMTMAGYAREDLPFHHALADAFTVCDAYHCSITSSTNPNRAFLMGGGIDPHGRGGGPMFRQPLEDANYNLLREELYSWTTYPERLQAAGIDWRIYQGVDADGPFRSDAQDAVKPRAGAPLARTDAAVSCFNQLRFFQAYNDAEKDSPLYERAMRQRPPSAFAADVLAGRLPSVSWICPPLNCSEHPANRTPAEGAMFIAGVLNALTARPETWSRTVLLVLYDENDGFFDHVVPPMPPASRAQGLSNIDIAGEIHEDGLPYGLGPRVPMFAVSPWSRGGAVCSQVFDHTSVIRFLEARFGVMEPNITPWRRAVCGDLTAIFDFARPDARPVAGLPVTDGYRAEAEAQAWLPPPALPAHPAFPAQADTRRPFRPLPYAMDVTLRHRPSSGAVRLRLANDGTGAAVLQVFDLRQEGPPRFYTIAPGTWLEDDWATGPAGEYDLYVLGPAGFLRHFSGAGDPGEIALTATGDRLRLNVSTAVGGETTFQLTDLAYGAPARTARARPGAPGLVDWPIQGSDHWYDLEVTCPSAPGFRRRFCGHVETGAASRSDPALVGPRA